MNEHNEEYTVDDPRLTAFALGELEGDEAQGMEEFVARSPEARAAVEEIRACTGMLEEEFAQLGGAELTSAQREAIDAQLEPVVLVPRKRSRVLRVGAWVATAAAVTAFVWVFIPLARKSDVGSFTYALFGGEEEKTLSASIEQPLGYGYESSDMDALQGLGYMGDSTQALSSDQLQAISSLGYSGEVRPVLNIKQDGSIWQKRENYFDPGALDGHEKLTEFLFLRAQEMAEGPENAHYASGPEGKLLIRCDGNTHFKHVQKVMEISGIETIKLWKLQLAAAEIEGENADDPQLRSSLKEITRVLSEISYAGPAGSEPVNNEFYAPIVDNPFMRVRDDSLSTFSIDVDTASYANTRRHLLAQSILPPPDAVRIEELINYFPYNYPSPDASQPFSVNVEVASAPWRPEHRLVKIGLKGREPVYSERKNANLVFLIDVSGSMNYPQKLPLLVESLSMLVRNLDSSDRVAIVVYAGSSGLVLDSTSCSEKPLIIGALERLSAGGSTNGGQGIRLAYAVAQRNFVDGGINRVVLATDGDFNVGTTSQAALEELITEKARDGVFLSVLGFGSGNLKDSTMELLADKGNGNYNYIDSRIEGHKVLVEQLGGTLVAIAKDVKIQIEFNPAEVQAFRLIGYENRVLAHRDFNDDTKDAGEIGSGHTVTALYEVVPTGVEFDFRGVDALRYQANPEPEKAPTEAANSGEMMTLKLRFKEPEGSISRKIVYAVHDKGGSIEEASEDFRFAASVASFGMLLRRSIYKGSANWEDTLRLAQEGQGADVGGYRLEFAYLVQRASKMSR